MLKRGNKLISKLLFLAMCTSLLPTTIVFAEEENVSRIIQTTNSAVSATSVTLNYTSLSMVVGNTKALVATVLPSDATNKVMWSSSNTDVALVDENGLVRVRELGSATITCTALDNSGQSETCLVTSIPYNEFGEETVQIGLRSNGSTGYQWQYNTDEDGIIEEVSKTYVGYHPIGSNIVGGSETTLWTFKGLKSGSTKVTFRYLRSWVGEAVETKTFLFIVNNELGVTVIEVTGNESIGDVNNDSGINILDYIALKKYISNNSININTQNADINKDTKIDILDLVALKKLIVI